MEGKLTRRCCTMAASIQPYGVMFQRIAGVPLEWPGMGSAKCEGGALCWHAKGFGLTAMMVPRWRIIESKMTVDKALPCRPQPNPVHTPNTTDTPPRSTHSDR